MLPYWAFGTGFKHEEKEDLGIEAEGLGESTDTSCVGGSGARWQSETEQRS